MFVAVCLAGSALAFLTRLAGKLSREPFQLLPLFRRGLVEELLGTLAHALRLLARHPRLFALLRHLAELLRKTLHGLAGRKFVGQAIALIGAGLCLILRGLLLPRLLLIGLLLGGLLLVGLLRSGLLLT